MGPAHRRPRHSASMEILSFERFEYKYYVPESLVEDIRRFVAPYLRLDPYCAKDPSRTYTITNLYWDTPGMRLYTDHLHGSVDRLKLRIRTYGPGVGGPTCFFEVKRKVRQVIVKHRAVVPRDCYEAVLDGDPGVVFEGPTRAHLDSFLGELLRYGAQPAFLLRYQREAYENIFDEDARVTFDRAICYQAARGIDLRGDDRGWTYVDGAESMRGVPQPTLVELKFGSFVPAWMMDLIRTFDLERSRFSKYMTVATHQLEHPGGGLDDYRRSSLRV